ncbi:hypothetical protein LCGC14_0543590 [marine sediment metagenome]|uniref:Uncharacterized protein n=1 Tax=marine sediment metagenome TaxID=412755 RepID=A0A0F9RS49_9ZZZZ
MKRTWTQVGKEHTEGKEAKLNKVFNRLEWQSIPCTMPMAPGEGLKGVIKKLRIPKVSHVAYSHELAPYGLMGAKAHYKNGDATIYMIDKGDIITILATDFYPAS